MKRNDPLSLIVFRSYNDVQYERSNQDDQKNENNDGLARHYPRKISTMSLVPEVVSRYSSEYPQFVHVTTLKLFVWISNNLLNPLPVVEIDPISASV